MRRADAALPDFAWTSEVAFDEMDPNGVLHNARFAVHVERAVSALNEALVGSAAPDERPADLRYAVRAFAIEFLAPVRRPGPMLLHLWVSHVGTTSMRIDFKCRGPEGAYAVGTRSSVKLDAATGRPAPWSTPYREALARMRTAGGCESDVSRRVAAEGAADSR